jgi:site-specific recombinase XerD
MVWEVAALGLPKGSVMRQELADFLDFCRLERRLAPLTCSAYERDVGACLGFLDREGIKDLA